MILGVNIFSLIPMRAEPRDAAEMVSQVLFGEAYTVLEDTEKWLQIRTEHDSYIGWIDRKQHYEVDEIVFQQAKNCRVWSIDIAYSAWQGDEHLLLPPASVLVNYNMQTISIADKHWDYNGEFISVDLGLQLSSQRLCDMARRYLGTPYLWGGRSSFGIDCSGLVQSVFRLANVALPRDAYQQAEVGMTIDFANAQAGDVAFFQNDKGRVVHTGILLDTNSIIHASGKVRIDKFSEQGIWNTTTQTFSHNCHSIKRYL